jgi:concanavalin A-like lectin/glucanase superfamily protein
MGPPRLVFAAPMVVAGCAGILGFPEVPDVGDTGDASGACCDAGHACVGAGCDDAVDDSSGASTDATIEAPVLGGGGDLADTPMDNTTSSESSGEPTTGVSVSDVSTEPEAAADGRVLEAEDSALDESDAMEDASLDVGLVALYHFDETSGTTSADSSGNGNTATMEGGATFSPGVRGNAATFDGTDQYVMLPVGIVSALTDFSISAWIYQTRGAVGFGDRLFDFGTGETVNMFITTDGNALRYAVTTGGHPAEETLLTSGILPLDSWQHLAVTQAGTTATLYHNGELAKQSTATTLDPAALGVTTQNWIGRSQYVKDHYLAGEVDEFRIYRRALSAAEVMALYVERR